MATRNDSKDKQSFTVVGALAIVKGKDGRVVYLYRGAEVPEGVSKEEIDRLVDLGLVEEGADVVPGVAVKPE